MPIIPSNGGIADFCADPIVAYDREGRATYINPAFERVFGWKSRDLLGKRIDFIPEQAVEQTRQAVARVLSGEAVLGMETIRKTRNSGIIHVRLSASTLKDETGGFNGIVVTLQDITDLVLSRYEVIKAGKVQNDFLSNISHEIRTPLNGLFGMIDLIRNTRLDDEQREYAEALRDSASKLMSVISDLLDYSGIESGNTECRHIGFDLREALALVNQEALSKAEAKQLKFVFALDEKVPSFLKGDPEKLRQALHHLLENAVKFTEKGEIRLCISPAEETRTHIMIRFEVADTGIGIDQDQVGRIFEAFSQADAGTTRKYGGIGIGLTISKMLVHLMGGTLQADSTPGRGSKFIILLEFEKKQTDGVMPMFRINRNLTGKSLLVVDDDAVSRMVIRGMAGAWGCSCEEAAGAQRALEKIESTEDNGRVFDAVLIHMQPDDTAGEMLAAEIRKKTNLDQMVVIMLYSAGKPGDAERLQAAGADGYLPKPIDADLLFESLTTALAFKENRIRRMITRHSLREIRKQFSDTANTVHHWAGTPVFNIEPVLERAMGDMEFLEMVVNEFVRTLPEKVSAIRQCIDEHNLAGLTQKAHSLRGSGATMGAKRLSAAARKVEQAGDSGDLEAAESGIREVEEEIREFVSHVKTINWSSL